MKIVGLIAENVKRIKVVDVRAKGKNVIVVGGQNDQGKSSLLDAIEMALAGKRVHPKEPLRRGARRGRVVVELEDMVITRTFSAGGGTELVLESKAGKRFASPQAMIDKFYSSLTFDPLSFERQDHDKQAETIRAIVGLDFRDLDLRRQELYDQRTDENRSVKALQVTYDATVHHDDAPDEEVSIDELTRELGRAEQLQNEANAADRAVDAAESEAERLVRRMEEESGRIRELRRMLEQSEVKLKEYQAQHATAETAVTAAVLRSQEASKKVPNTTTIRARLSEASAINQKVQENRRHYEASSLLEEARARVIELTMKIDAIDEQKADQLASAKYPVDGLSMSPDGTVLFGGIPFEQASTSDRIRVSVAMGLALNPQLRVLLVRDGSLIGETKLRIIEEMVQQADAQLWIEMMQEEPTARTTVFIHDGMVVSRTSDDRTAAATAKT